MSVVTKEIQDQVSQLYIAFFGRAPDALGFAHWTQGLASGFYTPNSLAAQFGKSPEFESNYGGLTPTQQVERLYTNVLNRTGDPEGVAYWAAKVAAGLPFSEVAWEIVNTSFTGGPGVGAWDQALVVNKVAVSEYFAITLASNDGALAKTAFDGVTSDPATVTAAEARLAGGSGTVFTLTTGVDVIVGGASNDTINGVSDGAATTTFNPLDVIDGGGGTNKMVLTNSVGTMTLTTAATVTNIQEAILRSGDGVITANVSGWSGLKSVVVEQLGTKAAIDIDTSGNATSVSISGGTTVAIDDNATTANNALTSVTLNGNTGAATIGAASTTQLTNLAISNTDQNATISAAAAARALSLSLNNVTGGTISDGEATTLSVSSTGKESTGVTLTAGKATSVTIAADEKLTVADVNIAAAKTITVTGDSAVTITATADVTALESITSVDSTGGVTIGATLGDAVLFTGGAGKDSITLALSTKSQTMGAGDDTVTLTGSALGAEGKVDGGEGKDTLVMTHANAILATASTTVTNFSGKVTGFEILQVGASAAAGEIKVGSLNNTGWNAVNEVVFAGAVDHATTVSGLVSGATVGFKAANAAATTLSVKDADVGTADVLNISISSIAAGINVNTVNAADVETVNFLTDDTAATPTGIQHTATLGATSAKSITVTGDAGLALTFTGTALTSFDASAVSKGAVNWTTGALTTAADIKGGEGANTINFAAATKAVTYTGGAGVDTITTNNSNNTVNTGAGNDVVTLGTGRNTVDLGAGNDTITLGNNLNVVTLGAGNDVVNMAITQNGNTYSTITDFTNGSNSISFVAVSKGTIANKDSLGAAITLGETAAFADYLNAAAAGNGGTNALVTWFQYTGDTYVVLDNDALGTFQAGVDSIVKMSGLIDLSTAGLQTEVLAFF